MENGSKLQILTKDILKERCRRGRWCSQVLLVLGAPRGRPKARCKDHLTCSPGAARPMAGPGSGPAAPDRPRAPMLE